MIESQRVDDLTIDIGIICSDTDGFATAIPLTAEVTDTAGVKTPKDTLVLWVPKSMNCATNHQPMSSSCRVATAGMFINCSERHKDRPYPC